MLRQGLASVACAALLGAASCRDRDAGTGRLRILTPYLPETFDPNRDSRLVSRILAVNVFDPLVRSGATGEPVPALASTWSNPTPNVWRLQLKAGARFSDGSPVTAADVVRSFERARASGSIVAGNLASVRDVRATAPGVVTITAAEGSSVLLETLTAVLVSREVSDGAGGRRLVGTGPYVVTRFVPAERVEMRAATGGGRGAPWVTEVLWEPFGRAQAAGERLGADPRTLVIDPPPEAVAFARKDPRFTVSSAFSGALAYLAFGLGPAGDGGARPFSDRRVREAVRHAIDLPPQQARNGPVSGYPATQVVPTGLLGVDREIPLRGRDLDRARALLREAGATGRRATLDTTELNAATARAIASQLGEAGLAIDVRVLPPVEFGERIDGRSDLFVFSWIVGADAGEALKNFFHARDPDRRLGLRNRTGNASPEFDAAIEEALRVGEPESRLPVLQRSIRVLDRDVPWVPLFTIRSVRIHPAGVRLLFRNDSMLLVSELAPVRR